MLRIGKLQRFQPVFSRIAVFNLTKTVLGQGHDWFGTTLPLDMPRGTPSTLALRQHLQASCLLGVNFVPLPAKARLVAGPAENHQEARAPIAEETTDSTAMARLERTPPETEVTLGREPSVPKWAVWSLDSNAMADRQAALEWLRERHDRSCAHCTVATGHTRLVFGEGNPAARLMFIGEAPGEEEDRTGRPFVGRAGQKLDDIIRAMGLSRELVYIANVLKARPPNNRTPLQPEVQMCGPFLAEQIAIVRPEVIVSLGNPATQYLLGTELGITRLRGTWQRYVDSNRDFAVPVMPTFHPSFVLRNYTAETRGKVWSDMQSVIARLKEI